MPDASVVAKWVLPEVGSEEALALARGWAEAETRAVVPTLLWSEVGNVLHRRAISSEIKPSEARLLFQKLLDIGLETRSELPVCVRALEIAQDLGLGSVYDAVYLAVAEAEGAEFWTFDARLHRLASRRLPWVRLAEVADQ